MESDPLTNPCVQDLGAPALTTEVGVVVQTV